LGFDVKGMLEVDRLGSIPDRPRLIFWLELKSKIFVLRFFPRLKPFGVLGHTPEPNSGIRAHGAPAD